MRTNQPTYYTKEEAEALTDHLRAGEVSFQEDTGDKWSRTTYEAVERHGAYVITSENDGRGRVYRDQPSRGYYPNI